MKIIGSVTSPFTRIVRVLCEELKIPYDFQVTAPYSKLDADQDAFIALHNPLMKVPVLQDGNVSLIESRIIAEYLLSKYPNNIKDEWSENPIEKENILSAVLGVMDAGILSFSLRISNPGIDTDSGYILRCMNSMKSGLIWLNKQPTFGDNFGLPELVLICGLDWISKRDVIPWREYSQLTHIYEKYGERKSFQTTAIPESI